LDDKEEEGDMVDLGKMFGAGDVTTFLGFENVTPDRLLPGDLAFLGVPGATPYASVGPYCANAPKAVRGAAALYAANVEKWHFDLNGPVIAPGRRGVDLGDVAYDTDDFAANRANIRQLVSDVLASGAVPFVMGGDDSVPIPVFEAFAGRGPFTILQIDAHIDWRDSVDGETRGLSSTMRRASEMTHIKGMVQVGQRGLGSASEVERRAALDYGASLVPMARLRREGVGAAVDLIPEGADVLLTLDVDALDPAIMPGVIARTGGGMSFGEIIDLVDGVAAKARLCGVNMIEFMPERDIDGLGAMTVAQVMMHMMGRVSRQG